MRIVYYKFIPQIIILSLLLSCCSQKHSNSNNLDGNNYVDADNMPYVVSPIAVHESKVTSVLAGKPLEKSLDFFKSNTYVSGSFNITCELASNDGNLWFGYIIDRKPLNNESSSKNGSLRESGLGRYDGDKITLYGAYQGFPTEITCITQDKAWKIWFGTYGRGICCFDGEKITSYTTEQGLHSNYVHCIYIDNKNYFWFGTNHLGKELGLNYYDGSNFLFYKNGGADNILADSTGRLWITNSQGLCSFDSNKFTYYKEVQRYLHWGNVCIGKDSKGDLWFGTLEPTITKYDGKKFTIYTTEQFKTKDGIHCIFTDRNSSEWFGTLGGLINFKDNSFFPYFSTELSGAIVKSIVQEKNGNLMLGTNNRGIFSFDGKNFTRVF
jgi:hypothetical protein